MEIDKDKFKNMLSWFLDQMQSLEIELLAHQVLCASLKPVIGDLDESLEEARRSQGVSELILKRYEPIRGTLDQLIEAAQRDQDDLEEFLRKWKPEGPPN